jgi:hypothetical protein
MLRVHFTAEDLTRTVVTAAPDPLWEVLLSGFRLRERCRPVSFRPWMAALAAHRPHATMVRTAAVCCESWLRWAVFPGLPDPDGRPPRIERRPGRVVQYSAARVTGPTRAARAAETLPDWVRPLADGETAVVTRRSRTPDDGLGERWPGWAVRQHEPVDAVASARPRSRLRSRQGPVSAWARNSIRAVLLLPPSAGLARRPRATSHTRLPDRSAVPLVPRDSSGVHALAGRVADRPPSAAGQRTCRAGPGRRAVPVLAEVVVGRDRGLCVGGGS